VAAAHVLALDVGGTAIKAGLVTREGVLTETWRRATGAERGPDAVIEGVVAFAADLAAGAAAAGTPVAAAGVALPGILDEQAGVGVYSATLGWRDVPFRRLLTERLDVPVAIGHDVRAGGLAEARIGAGRGSSRFVFLPLGTSVGGAIMLDGRASLGPHGIGGEFGHIVVRPGGVPCECGLAGCLAQYASAGAVVKRYREAVGLGAGGAQDADGAQGADGTLGTHGADGTQGAAGVTGAADVAARLAAGDPVAARVWAEAVDALADAVLTTAALLDPDRVVVGGGLAECGEVLLGPLAAALAAKATFHALPDLVAAELGDLAGCLGAGLLGWDLVR
jgi:glucokinase